MNGAVVFPGKAHVGKMGMRNLSGKANAGKMAAPLFVRDLQ